MRNLRSTFSLACTVLLFAAGCGDDPEPSGTDPDAGENDAGLDATSDSGVDAAEDVGPDDTADEETGEEDVVEDGGTDTAVDADAGTDAESDTADTTTEPQRPACDPLDEAACSLPWPSNLYLVEDEERATGYALRFGDTSLPANIGGLHISPDNYFEYDGYGRGVPVMTLIPDVNIDGWATEGSIERSMEDDSPSLLFRVTEEGLEQTPHWVELDGFADEGEPAVLYLRPAVILDEATRYIVAFRDVTNTAGEPIAPSDAFTAVVSGDTSADEALAVRSERLLDTIGLLDEAGVEPAELYLAWDFNTASEQMLHARLDEAIELVMGALGDGGATIRFEDVDTFSPDEGGDLPQSDSSAYRILGFMETPSIVRERGGPGWELNIDENGDLQLTENRDAYVRIHVPHIALEEPVGVIVYGHGLLGSADEVMAGHLRQLCQDLGFIMVGVDLWGMSDNDNAAVLTVTFDMSNMEVIGDGLHQGIAQTHVLARTAITSLPEQLAELDDRIQIDPDRLFWFGASQGGIFGTSIVATSPDIDQGLLAVPGNNYSTMLHRSVNFAPLPRPVRQ